MPAIDLAKAFGLTIRESANDGSDFTNPDADYRRLFLGEDGLLHLKDSAGTVTDIGSGSGAVATDAIWDAAGDTVHGTGANTAARLAAGTANQVYRMNSGATAPEWASLLASAENFLTGDVTMTSANTFYDGPSLTLAAGTWLIVANILISDTGAAAYVTGKVWDGTTIYGDVTANYQGAGLHLQLTLHGLAVLSGSTTVKCSAAANATGCIMRATAAANGTTNKASHMIAVRIA